MKHFEAKTFPNIQAPDTSFAVFRCHFYFILSQNFDIAAKCLQLRLLGYGIIVNIF